MQECARANPASSAISSEALSQAANLASRKLSKKLTSDYEIVPFIVAELLLIRYMEQWL